MNLVFEECDHHRNGISGTPFVVVTFLADGEPLVAVLFPGENNTAVFDRELLGDGVIAFGKNSHRGDYYDTAVRQYARESGYDPG